MVELGLEPISNWLSWEVMGLSLMIKTSHSVEIYRRWW